MNDYMKRMSAAGLKSYIRSDIITYDSLTTMLGEDEDKVIVHEAYLPGFLSFQKSIDRYLINTKENKTFSNNEIRDKVYNSFSLKNAVIAKI